MGGVVHVAAGALVDTTGRVLIARRHADVHQGGLWEFPGGKMEAGEGGEAALARELHEELGIQCRVSRPLIRVSHRYPGREVVLHVYRVSAWSGNPHGREGQPLQWVDPHRLDDYPMPAADRPVVAALRLPDRYVITPPRVHDCEGFLDALERRLAEGVRLLQYRIFDVAGMSPGDLFRQVDARCRSAGASVLLNADLQGLQDGVPVGLHLSGRRLHACARRPAGPEWVAASCHSADDLRRAEHLGLDFAVLSPVLPTRSHPDAEPLRWEGFSRMVRTVTLPVYALGGMHAGLLTDAWDSGAQGVAGIRGFWSDASV